jgi:hypothetical protein
MLAKSVFFAYNILIYFNFFNKNKHEKFHFVKKIH